MRKDTHNLWLLRLCVLTLALTFLVTGCGDTPTPESSAGTPSTEASTTSGSSGTTTDSSTTESTGSTVTTGATTGSTTTAKPTTGSPSKTTKVTTTAKPTTTKKPLPALTIYPVAKELADNVKGTQHTVKVNGKNSFVYQSEVTIRSGYVTGFAEYTAFDFHGSVTVEVTAHYAVASVEILPSRDNIAFKQEGNTVTFTLTEPGQLFVKINGDHTNGNSAPHPLYIFANPPEENIPSKSDPNVVYFEPGVYYHQTYYLESNTTYYLAPGAFVYGRFYGHSLENVTICGRGTLCGEELTSMGDDGRTICIKNAKNVTVEGIQVMDPKVWTVAFYQSKDIHVDNIMTISHGQSADGIDICGSQDVLVENSFFRGHDDMLAVKPCTMSDYENPVPCKDIVFRNCVVWCDSSNPMTIGYETVGDVNNVLYECIDVLNQSKSPVWKLEAIMAIEPHYKGTVDGVIYRDIRIDLALDSDPENLVRFVIDNGSGTIRNIRVENVFVNYGGLMKGTIAGSTRAPDVENITFVNVRNSEGVKMTLDDLVINSLVKNVTVE